MTYRVLVVGHADADGHLIAEQIRRNLALLNSFKVRVVVDPARTKDHRAWMNLDAISEIEEADYVFFVDLMFAPATYWEEADSLKQFVKARPEKRFFLIDHHPLPLSRLGGASNLRVLYRPDVSECVIGPRSGMMIVAALCEGQNKEVADVKTPIHEALAIGMRRAAALGGSLPGNKLLALLRADRWNELLDLAKDDPRFHRLPRGLRPASQSPSKTLVDLDEAASGLLARADNATDIGRGTAMSYDTDIENEELSYEPEGRSLRKDSKASSKDLGVIVTVLEVAALSLTSGPGATFTFDQLVREARAVGGESLDLDEGDLKKVLEKSRFVKKAGKQYQLR